MTVVMGIDVGTSGVRTMVTNAAGAMVAELHAPLADSLADGSCHEQRPQDWWSVVCRTVQGAVQQLKASGEAPSVAGIAVTSTSGSLVLADANGMPVRPAIIYDDARSAAVAAGLAESNREIHSSYSLAKAAWVRETEPTIWEKVKRVLHPGDWLTGKLTGNFEFTDTSSISKSFPAAVFEPREPAAWEKNYARFRQYCTATMVRS
jgi:sugar (pentulose or hexulose) kinase